MKKKSEIREEVYCTGPSSFKQTKQNLNRMRIEGGEAFFVNCGQSALIGSQLSHKLIYLFIFI